MARYRAIVSITFNDDDLAELAESFGVGSVEATECLDGELDNIGFGSAWVEQLFRDGEPTIYRASGGITVEVNPHEET